MPPGIDMNYLIRQANKLTEKIDKRKAELAEETLEHSAHDGRVVVTVTGTQELRSLKIDPVLIDPSDAALLEDMVAAAVNAALTASRDHMQKELGKVSGGVKIPGMM